MLAEISEREGEGRGHAQALRHPQDREGGEVGCVGEKRRRHREHDQADEDPDAPVDVPAEITDREARDRHADRAGIDGNAHGGGRDAVMAGEGREDRLGGEQVDDGEEGRGGDDDEAQERGGGALHFGAQGLSGVRLLDHGTRLLGEKRGDVTPPGGESVTSTGESITYSCRWGLSAGRRKAGRRSCRRCSSTNETRPSSRRPRRRPCGRSAPRSCWHIPRSCRR